MSDRNGGKRRGWVNDMQPHQAEFAATAQPHQAEFAATAVLPWKGRLLALIGRPIVSIITVTSERHPGDSKANVLIGVRGRAGFAGKSVVPETEL